jgi:hypothetical protein
MLLVGPKKNMLWVNKQYLEHKKLLNYSTVTYCVKELETRTKIATYQDCYPYAGFSINVYCEELLDSKVA